MGGNWKLNPTTLASSEALVAGLVSGINDASNVDTVIFPPFPLMQTVKSKLHGSKIAVSFNHQMNIPNDGSNRQAIKMT